MGGHIRADVCPPEMAAHEARVFWSAVAERLPLMEPATSLSLDLTITPFFRLTLQKPGDPSLAFAVLVHPIELPNHVLERRLRSLRERRPDLRLEIRRQPGPMPLLDVTVNPADSAGSIEETLVTIARLVRAMMDPPAA